MKKENRQVVHALILVLQFGINMLVPIFMCSFAGVWIGNRTGISWMMIPFFFIGALAGGTNVYKMAKREFALMDPKKRTETERLDGNVEHAEKKK